MDDPEAVRGAIRELHAYGSEVRARDRPRRGIVYRVVSDAESLAIRYKHQNLVGMKRFVLEERIYGIPAGSWHFIDDRAFSHAHTRHGTTEMEVPAGHLALTVADVCRLPEVVHSRNIVEFCIVKGKARIVYELAFNDGMLRIVEEIQAKGGLAFKTCYKIK